MGNTFEKRCPICGHIVTPTIGKALGTPIEELGLSTRSRNILQRRGIENVEELVKLGESELLRLRGMGTLCLREIMDKVNSHLSA